MEQVNPYKTGLCKENAYWMARLAKEVYLTTSEDDQKPNQQQILENIQADDQNFIRVTGFDNNSAQGAVIEHRDYLTIAFRGTNEIADWLDNINAFSTKVLFGEVHRGFYQSVMDLWSQIDHLITEIQQNSDRKRPIFLTGHSLGGAMATIASAIFIHHDRPFTSTYTFGQPRALTQDTARLFNIECQSRYFRFHNNNDIVTRVPARVMGYSHVGTYLYISEEGEIHQEVGSWFRFVDSIDGVLQSIIREPGLDAINDHDMSDYLTHIERWDFKT